MTDGWAFSRLHRQLWGRDIAFVGQRHMQESRAQADPHRADRPIRQTIGIVRIVDPRRQSHEPALPDFVRPRRQLLEPAERNRRWQ
jgi:hypothetical protein